MGDLYCTRNDCYKNGARLGTVKWLIVHSPAVYPTIIRAQSGAGGGWYKRWNKSGVEKLVHGFIDDTGVYNFAPESLACWHVGNSTGNAHAIGYELCELDTAEEFSKVWNNAVARYAELCTKYGLTVDKILGHCEAHDKGIASNHSDPEPYFKRFGKSMNNFRADVQKSLSGAQTSSQTTSSPSVSKTYNPYAYGKVCNLSSGDYLNVRTAPNADASKLAAYPRLAAGNEVDVVKTYSNGWAQIRIAGKHTGYVNASYLTITEQSEQTSDKESSEYKQWVGVVHSTGKAGLNVRTGPGTGYGKLAAWSKLYDGNLVAVMGEEGNWYKILIAGVHSGYASKDYIKKNS